MGEDEWGLGDMVVAPAHLDTAKLTRMNESKSVSRNILEISENDDKAGMFKDITMDWDFAYDDLENSIAYQNLFAFIEKNKEFIESVWKRRSSSDNAHGKIVLKEPISPFVLIQVRTMLRDDRARAANDIIRLGIGEPINRLWDSKNGKFAGKWIQIWPEVKNE